MYFKSLFQSESVLALLIQPVIKMMRPLMAM